MQTFSKIYRHSRHILRNINSKVCCISTYRYKTLTKNKDTWKRHRSKCQTICCEQCSPCL